METVMLSREWCIRSVTSTAGLRARKTVPQNRGFAHLRRVADRSKQGSKKDLSDNQEPSPGLPHGVAPAKLERGPLLSIIRMEGLISGVNIWQMRASHTDLFREEYTLSSEWKWKAEQKNYSTRPGVGSRMSGNVHVQFCEKGSGRRRLLALTLALLHMQCR
uniref:Uncharacterized protein n=1 Tax=Phlegmariurus squarrosus TaxID=73615 RepID=H9M897_PHLSQ|nr:hypothetical protein HusqMp126 [Phlegmariurus squarrosus]AEV55804.1 hypothetical protein HusqMp126 [Phlegmariurus squarrosus]